MKNVTKKTCRLLPRVIILECHKLIKELETLYKKKCDFYSLNSYYVAA